jgi:hypothetical protein
VLATRRLPGIRVDVAPPPAVEALPRMDVAVMVGFASTGPLHLPVAIESVAQYAAVFGPDAPLAWDEGRGERVRAFLGPAVRAFFSNGGRRCWVIRVARVAGPGRVAVPLAQANAFAIPGVLALEGSQEVRPAMAQARCEGAWSDRLRVAAAIQKRTFGVEAFAPVPAPPAGRFAFRTRHGLRPGDLIELDDGDGLNAYATVDSVSVAPDPAGPYAVQARVRAAFEHFVDPVSPPGYWVGEATVAGFGTPVPARLYPPAIRDVPARLCFDAPVPAEIERGHWARFEAGMLKAWLRMDRIEREPDFTGAPPSTGSTMVKAEATGPAWKERGAGLPFPPTSVRRAHRLALELCVDEGSGNASRMGAIGLTPEHPDAWWNQWVDADFHCPPDDVGAGRAAQPVPAEVPRFPLARAAGDPPIAWVPLGAGSLYGPALSRLPAKGTALERDGLVPFDASLFLDPDLAAAPMESISGLADNVRYLGTPTRTLRGLHAAWSIGAGGLFNEASLLAIPDAVHPGWRLRIPHGAAEPAPPPTDTPPTWRTHRGACGDAGREPLSEPDFGAFLDCATRVLDAPRLEGPAGPVPPGAYRLGWTPSEPGARYVLKEATRPDFGDAREIPAGTELEYVVLNPREGTYYYQVVAWAGDDRSDGSNAIAVVVRSDDWVQQFPGEGDADMEAQWLAVHRAALRMAAAGGELFVALAMPRHFRTQQALRYAARLRAVREPPGTAEPGALGFTEGRALSYGALYFPWLQSDLRANGEPRDAALAGLPGDPRVVPPDGVALGILAARASDRGAWIAAANEPMKDVVALTPPVGSEDWQALQDAQVNLLRADPRGFLTLSADTLSADADLRPINVRRLLILLRRLALRRGTSYVFEPNGPALRRAVERGFGTLLADLFRRGAFAGATPAQSFRVVTDDTINTPADAEAGRFLVELRVAPSIPMRFISVQLAQSGARLAVTEEL